MVLWFLLTFLSFLVNSLMYFLFFCKKYIKSFIVGVWYKFYYFIGTFIVKFMFICLIKVFSMPILCFGLIVLWFIYFVMKLLLYVLMLMLMFYILYYLMQWFSGKKLKTDVNY